MYPSRLQYQNAVVNQMFPVEENGGYKFEAIVVNDEPVVSSGGNAIVFKVVDAKGDYYAIKLFTEELSGRQQRLRSIAEFLDNLKSKYFTHFTYVEKLIYVEVPGVSDEQSYYPGIVMKWLEGKTLDEKLRELVAQKELTKIKQVAENFKKLAFELLQKEIAHGDLKLSNIMIDEKLHLSLIDYDGMYVPTLAGQQAIEIGTVSYQHPLRSAAHFGADIDQFSILNIYYSLLAISERPEIYNTYNDGDNVIFSKEDFLQPSTSSLLHLLETEKFYLNSLFFLKKSLASNSIEVPYLDKILQGKYPDAVLDVIHEPLQLVNGQVFALKWASSDAEFLSINGEEDALNGEKNLIAQEGQLFEFVYGYAEKRQEYLYKINIGAPPEIVFFDAQHRFLKAGEPLVLKWQVQNAERILLVVGKEVMDVTGKNEILFAPTFKDLSVSLRAKAKNVDFFVEKKFEIVICHPVVLRVEQEKKITIKNRPVNLYLDVTNADNVLLRPGNHDLTGKKVFTLEPNADLRFEIVASNQRYSESFTGRIDVLRYPEYNHRVINFPELHLRVADFTVKIPEFDFRKEQKQHFSALFKRVRSAFSSINWKKINLKTKL